MPRKLPPKPFTKENAREMQARAAKARVAKREEAERLAADRQDAILGAALRVHEQMLADPEARAQAPQLIREAYERYLGRAPQTHELVGEGGGPVSIVLRSAFDDSGSGSTVSGERPAE